jgi:glucokinase
MTAITEEGPLPYVDLVDRLPGVTTIDHVRNIVAAAEDRRVLQGATVDCDLPRGLREGKPPATQYVEINRAAGCVVGLNVGRTYFAIGAADPNGQLFSAAGAPPRELNGHARAEAEDGYRAGQIVTHDRPDGVDGRTLLKRTGAETEKWLKAVGVKTEEVRGVTLSLPAPVSTTESRVLTNSIEPGFGSIGSIEEEFRRTLKGSYPNLEKVIIANDADVAARGEVRYGRAYRKKDVIAIHAAYGIGAGLITDGRVLRTGSGGGAGEIGHCMARIGRDKGAEYGLVPLDADNELFTCVCGCYGHLEAMAGGQAIVNRLAASLGDVDPPPPDELAALLEDPQRSLSETLDALLHAISGADKWQPGLEAVLDAGHMIGGAVHTLTHLLKPEAVYLCGKLSEAGEPFVEVVREGFRRPGSLQNYSPDIERGDARSEFERRHIMVWGAAMTAVRGTKPLITREDLEEL